ncbi:MAG: hypothetical protein K8I00_07740, partial [Candidatus Omnitrophica bacterium]|nr:hypothetical protein [Candidatus Omnitrophota bacterium]
MKSKLTMMLCLLVMTGTMLWTETLQAEDYGIQQTRRKIWNLLKEERPDYYGQRDASHQQLAMNTANY